MKEFGAVLVSHLLDFVPLAAMAAVFYFAGDEDWAADFFGLVAIFAYFDAKSAERRSRQLERTVTETLNTVAQAHVKLAARHGGKP